MIDIKILNSDTELKSFPITQSLKLSSTVELDTTSLNDHIILFRTIPEKGLVSLVEPYSYTVGYIKEKFSTVDLSFTQNKENDTFTIDVKPTKVLSLDSDYILYITKNVIASNSIITKTLSKSNSTLKVSVRPPAISQSTQVTVKTTSKFVDGNNLTTFLIGSQEVTLNLKQNKYITIGNVTYLFEDVVYVAGETFKVEIKSGNEESVEDILYKFKTAPSDTIKVINNQTPSSSINTQDILNFYNRVNTIKESLVVIPKYIAPNIFSVELPDGYSLNTTKGLEVSIREAFNNYLLKDLDLYEQSNYTLYIYQENQELIVEIIYNDDPDTEHVTVLNDNSEPLLFTSKRRGRT